MARRKPQLVPEGGKPRVSGLSHEEEARALKLADVALRNPTQRDPVQAKGTRAKAEHEKLMNELRDAAEATRSRRAA
jgi:hypothetical protein